MEEKKYIYIDGKKTRIEDLSGKNYGELTVINFDEKRYKDDLIKKKNNKNFQMKYYWICTCSCDNKYISVRRDKLLKGSNCGCIKKEKYRVDRSVSFKKSFEQWCLENNHQDYLDLWDFDLNTRKPNEVAFGSNMFFYFKCPKNIHKSELKQINNVTTRGFACIKCTSFAQWSIDNVDKDFLEKYWDYEKNTVDPWSISYGSEKFIWIKCQNNIKHGSYTKSAGSFSSGRRCPYCGHSKIHPSDSLGQFLKDNNMMHLWSDKNKTNVYEIGIRSNNKHWFKCENNTHDDYQRTPNNARKYKYQCPQCNSSGGEQKVADVLLKYNIEYIPQKEYEGLLGINGGNLKFDFAIPSLNINIEYDGIGHYEPTRFNGIDIEIAEEKFKLSKKHDKLKNEFCKKNKIKLIRIPYWDLYNIEEILKTELKLN